MGCVSLPDIGRQFPVNAVLLSVNNRGRCHVHPSLSVSSFCGVVPGDLSDQQGEVSPHICSLFQLTRTQAASQPHSPRILATREPCLQSLRIPGGMEGRAESVKESKEEAGGGW